jgi:hypothetical protein
VSERLSCQSESAAILNFVFKRECTHIKSKETITKLHDFEINIQPLEGNTAL